MVVRCEHRKPRKNTNNNYCHKNSLIRYTDVQSMSHLRYTVVTHTLMGIYHHEI